MTSRLIRTYTVCYSVIDFVLKPSFEEVDMAKFKDVNQKLGKGLMKKTEVLFVQI